MPPGAPPGMPGPAMPPPGMPGAGLPPPGAPPPAVATGKFGNPALKIVLVVLAGLLALCCVGGAVVGFFIFRAAQDVKPARAAAVVFVRDLETGDIAGAYSRLCASTRREFPPDVFDATVSAQPKIIGYKIVDTSMSNVNGTRAAQIVMDLSLASGRVERHTFLLSRENGKWLVCGTPY
jgi:hypothetical protein